MAIPDVTSPEWRAFLERWPSPPADGQIPVRAFRRDIELLLADIPDIALLSSAEREKIAAYLDRYSRRAVKAVKSAKQLSGMTLLMAAGSSLGLFAFPPAAIVPVTMGIGVLTALGLGFGYNSDLKAKDIQKVEDLIDNLIEEIE